MWMKLLRVFILVCSHIKVLDSAFRKTEKDGKEILNEAFLLPSRIGTVYCKVNQIRIS